MIRSDVHRPSVINPDDYRFIAMEHTKFEGIGSIDEILENRRIVEADMKATGGTYSRHAHGGNCHICGNANAIYTALFHHEATNTYIRVGSDCADKLDCGLADRFRSFAGNVRNALEAQAGKRKAEAFLTREGIESAWAIYLTKWTEGEGKQESIIRDIVGKMVTYGSLSEKQVAFLRSLLKQIADRPAIEAQRKLETERALPVPVVDGRTTVKGIVVTMRSEESFYGPTVKMLVKHVDGWKVWGTVPSALVCQIGDTVQFDAKVTRSDKDEKFGFFSRPSKASVI